MSATFRFSSFAFNFAISVTSLRSFSAKTNDGTAGIEGSLTERQRLANSEWRAANSEWRMMSFLEGSALTELKAAFHTSAGHFEHSHS
jgi:hypothetical protein